MENNYFPELPDDDEEEEEDKKGFLDYLAEHEDNKSEEDNASKEEVSEEAESTSFLPRSILPESEAVDAADLPELSDAEVLEAEFISHEEPTDQENGPIEELESEDEGDVETESSESEPPTELVDEEEAPRHEDENESSDETEPSIEANELEDEQAPAEEVSEDDPMTSMPSSGLPLIPTPKGGSAGPSFGRELFNGMPSFIEGLSRVKTPRPEALRSWRKGLAEAALAVNAMSGVLAGTALLVHRRKLKKVERENKELKEEQARQAKELKHEREERARKDQQDAEALLAQQQISSRESRISPSESLQAPESSEAEQALSSPEVSTNIEPHTPEAPELRTTVAELPPEVVPEATATLVGVAAAVGLQEARTERSVSDQASERQRPVISGEESSFEQQKQIEKEEIKKEVINEDDLQLVPGLNYESGQATERFDERGHEIKGAVSPLIGMQSRGPSLPTDQTQTYDNIAQSSPTNVATLSPIISSSDVVSSTRTGGGMYKKAIIGGVVAAVGVVGVVLAVFLL